MEILNTYLSGIILPVLLIFLGIYFAIRLNMFYILHPFKTIKTILNNRRDGFKSLTVALAGTLGVGNIVGVASAILLGGAGSVFWMWISAFCAMSLKYVEVYLAMIYRKKQNGQFYGGASHYIKDGLKNKIGVTPAYFLSIIFAFFCVVNSLTTGNLVQINSVSSLLSIPPFYFGTIFTILAFIAIIGGLKRISKITSVLIPVLSIAYVLICVFIICTEIERLPKVISTIIKDAFSVNCAVSGFTGFGIASAIRFGVSRGVLSNEAGCGTSPSAHASSDSVDPHGQGCLGVFEVFVDTILLCSLTAFVILLSTPTNEKTPISLVLSAFCQFTGEFGANLIIWLTICFAFATVICQFFYGMEALNYISKGKAAKTVFIFLFCIVLLVGAVIPMELMWQISDLSIAIMTIVNLFCIFLLRKTFK